MRNIHELKKSLLKNTEVQALNRYEYAEYLKSNFAFVLIPSDIDSTDQNVSMLVKAKLVHVDMRHHLDKVWMQETMFGLECIKVADIIDYNLFDVDLPFVRQEQSSNVALALVLRTDDAITLRFRFRHQMDLHETISKSKVNFLDCFNTAYKHKLKAAWDYTGIVHQLMVENASNPFKIRNSWNMNPLAVHMSCIKSGLPSIHYVSYDPVLDTTECDLELVQPFDVSKFDDGMWTIKESATKSSVAAVTITRPGDLLTKYGNENEVKFYNHSKLSDSNKQS